MVQNEERWDELRRETFLVVGFTERTGRSAARLFEAHDVAYRVSDRRSLTELAPALSGLGVRPEHVFAGEQHPGQLDGVTQLLLSPGVPRTLPLVEEAQRRGLRIWSDIDLAYDFIRDRTIVGVTGTDGKTTTTMLVAAVLAMDRKVVVAGNMGVPILSVLDEIERADVVVLELSSFMLEALHCFRPTISTILNIAVDHVDRYPDFAVYREAKRAIVRHCTADDVFVHNLDDPELRGFVPGGARAVTLSRRAQPADFRFEDGWLQTRSTRLRYADCLLRGEHNATNALAAMAIGTELGVPPDAVLEAVRRFQPPPHRFEHLGVHGGVALVDDSKATTVHAVGAALASLRSPVVLIAGGQDKGLPFAELRRYADKLRWVVCYGEAGERIARELALAASEVVGPFAHAVEAAVRRAHRGDTLVLSPGCTSWDQFPSYEVRGRAFRDLAIAALSKPGQRAP